MKLYKSFNCAFKGFIYCINNERNMRIHIVVALYVLLFAPFFYLSKGNYAILFLTILSVICAEMFNTCIERLCNLFTTDYNPKIRIIKDISAGAVLVCAIFSVFVGISLFLNVNAYIKILNLFFNSPWIILIFILSVIVSIIFIVMGPLAIKSKLQKLLKR